MFGRFFGKTPPTSRSRIQPILSRPVPATDSEQLATSSEKPAMAVPIPLSQPHSAPPAQEVLQTGNAKPGLERVGMMDQAEFERVVASFPPHGPVRMSLTIDPMDDTQVITFSLDATSYQGDADTVPRLNIRARRKGITTTVEDFCFLGERYLFRRGPDPNVRLRWDSQEAVAAKVEPSTDQSALFFRSCELLCGITKNDRLLVQVVSPHGAPLLATFMPGAVRPAVSLLGAVILGPALPMAKEVPVFIVDWLLRCGPQHVGIYKEALRNLGFYKGDLGVSKSAELFRAFHSYAVARRVGEIFGYVDPNDRTKVNKPLSQQIYHEMLPALRTRLGPLKIFD